MCPFDLPINDNYIRTMTGVPKVPPCSAYTDGDLYDWLRWAEDAHGTNFLHAIAEAAFTADLKHYALLRPILLKLKADESRSAASSVVVDREEER